MPLQMPWSTATELVKDLGLTASSDDLAAVRREIRAELAALHPDRNGGEHFADAAAENRYKRLTLAFAFVDQPPSTALIPVDAIPALVEALRSSVNGSSRRDVTQLRAEFRTTTNAETRRRLLLPRVSSAALAATCAFLLSSRESLVVFAEALLPNGSSDLQPWLGRALLASAVLFVWTWFREQVDRDWAEWLSTETGLRQILRRVPRETARHTFSLANFVEALQAPREWPTIKAPSPFYVFVFLARRLRTPRPLGTAAAEQLAKAHLASLEERGALRRLPGNGINPMYELTDAEPTAGVTETIQS